MAESGVCPTCGAPLANGECETCKSRAGGPSLTLGSEAGILAVLTGIAILLFFLTNMAVGAYRTKESQLAKEWTQKGQALLAASHPSQAVEAFQTALRYEPGSEQLRYAMVDSLLAAGRREQAHSYLLSMREQEPANGRVNLQLGRIAATRGDLAQATYYYHNAIYGIWDGPAQQHRTEARLELARFLLSKKAKREADAELVALAANAPASPQLAERLGELFHQADDPQNAQEQFESVLKSSPRDAPALAGAGRAAFNLGRYAAARSFLERARARGDASPEIAQLLELTDLILQSDPLDRRVPFEVRVQRTVRALGAATDRLEDCAAKTDQAGGAPPQVELMLQQLDAAEDPKTLRAMRHDPDQLITSANLVFSAEEAAAKVCGQPEGLDLALLLIGRSHAEGAQ